MPLVKKKIILKKSNDVETQTDDVFVNDDQQLGSETNELFVLKTKWLKETTKKTIEIHDFTLKIEDEDKLKISSPNFKLAGKEFSIVVHPNLLDSGYISVALQNNSAEDQMTSITVQEASGVEASWEKRRILAGKSWGIPDFLSHENYRKLATVNDDVLRLEVVVTLHTKAGGEGWTR